MKDLTTFLKMFSVVVYWMMNSAVWVQMLAVTFSCVTFAKPLNLFKTPFPSGLTVSSSYDVRRIQCQVLGNLVYIYSSISIIIALFIIIIILLLLGLSSSP